MRRASQVIATPLVTLGVFAEYATQSHSFVQLSFLENELQRQLQCTRRVVRVRYNDFAESCTLDRVGCGSIILNRLFRPPLAAFRESRSPANLEFLSHVSWQRLRSRSAEPWLEQFS